MSRSQNSLTLTSLVHCRKRINGIWNCQNSLEKIHTENLFQAFFIINPAQGYPYVDRNEMSKLWDIETRQKFPAGCVIPLGKEFRTYAGNQTCFRKRLNQGMSRNSFEIDRRISYRFANGIVGHVRLDISSESLCHGGIPAYIIWRLWEMQIFAFLTILFFSTIWPGWIKKYRSLSINNYLALKKYGPMRCEIQKQRSYRSQDKIHWQYFWARSLRTKRPVHPYGCVWIPHKGRCLLFFR